MADKEKSETGESMTQKAELYAKNPQDIDKFTKEREKSEKEAADKADAKKTGGTAASAPAAEKK
jgi:hypothetical protein